MTGAPSRADAREWVLACVDGSAYSNSVCDHAGWFASDPEVGVDVRHVRENAKATDWTDPLVGRSVGRLRDEGVGPLNGAAMSGPFVEAVVEADADILVMGKRGLAGGGNRRRLGSNVDAVIRRCETPICLVPKVFLPIHRALVMLDANLQNRAALDFVIRDFRLSALPMDVMVVAQPGESADATVEWAGGLLSSVSADIFAITATGLDGAMSQYTQTRSTDLIVLPRAVVAPDPQAQLLRIEEGGLWSTRVPILIC